MSKSPVVRKLRRPSRMAALQAALALAVFAIAGGAALGALVDLMLGGRRGVVGALPAATVASAIARGAASIAAARPGLDLSVARAELTAAFEVAIAVGRGDDGSLCVTEAGELDVEPGGALLLPW